MCGLNVVRRGIQRWRLPQGNITLLAASLAADVFILISPVSSSSSYRAPSSASGCGHPIATAEPEAADLSESRCSHL